MKKKGTSEKQMVCNVNSIHYAGLEKVRRTDVIVYIRYEGCPDLPCFFHIPTPLQREVVRLKKTDKLFENSELLLSRGKSGKWGISFSCAPGNVLVEIPDDVFDSLEMEWLLPTNETCPVYGQVSFLQEDRRKSDSDFLWLKYQGITFYGASGQKLRMVMRGIVTDRFIFPDDNRIQDVYRTPERFVYSRDGVNWEHCPNDIRHLAAPRRCIFALAN